MPSTAVGISDNSSLGYRIDQQGFGEFMVFASGQFLPRTALSVTPITRAVPFGEMRTHYALLSGTGHIWPITPLPRWLMRSLFG
ncbi:hypothetical protein [Symbiopectobacterium sp.]|uniref:hypothetical protein n=1 Tax=Symbiopectobacterium sp. TaxID=2952789 RepID=UPI003F686143